MPLLNYTVCLGRAVFDLLRTCYYFAFVLFSVSAICANLILSETLDETPQLQALIRTWNPHDDPPFLVQKEWCILRYQSPSMYPSFFQQTESCSSVLIRCQANDHPPSTWTGHRPECLEQRQTKHRKKKENATTCKLRPGGAHGSMLVIRRLSTSFQGWKHNCPSLTLFMNSIFVSIRRSEKLPLTHAETICPVLEWFYYWSPCTQPDGRMWSAW